MVNQVATTEEFKSSISTGKLVVVDFYATWCGPCKTIAPKVVEFSKEFPEVEFIKVDVDDLSDVAADYSIRAMPTFLLFKDGEQVAEVVGANAAKLKAVIAEKAAA
ncbi:Thioredoxin-1 [Taphrina deformans PYCC 5710]|uniref:Thioredoxin n=1 Tax=Taphrina deformans (strain PYCC 5710 / ATCC 11124 / CBS 356.35 / IMI 108563 / JCM 9778 / NBRC 8474) TaxID=1097556 RepID=R4X913_TAPDE|nr:Thioredoxin-1 [Taphrina deformans PYCC 5710]|eukprot:CCG82164.1 Thioredoxin-1 [Taphrina deformans PYCC 5710]